ncbi:MAG TPA: hypothetical protein VK935_12265 [Actinomycetospora sp.]|nr:hypothetical protein [Actinomycetospora sp.]
MDEHPDDDIGRAVLQRLDELVALVRSVDDRLQRLERGSLRRPWPDDPEIGRPRRLDLPSAVDEPLTDAVRGGPVGRAGAT